MNFENVSFKPYSPELVDVVNQYITYLSTNKFPYYVQENENISLDIWDIAKRVEGTPSQWGGMVPGVSVDCAGSVMTILTMAGLFQVPSSVCEKLQGAKNRGDELSLDRKTLNLRLCAHMLYFVFRCVRSDLFVVPVSNPEEVFAGDIFSPPYYTIFNGQMLMPHLSVFVSHDAIMTTDPNSASVRIVDIASMSSLFDSQKLKDLGQYTIVWRTVSRKYRDDVCAAFEKQILETSRKMIRG